MSEFQYPPFTRISIKDMPDNYPQPKCDPKKVITLPPAAEQFDLPTPASITYRHHDKYRRNPSTSPPTSPPATNNTDTSPHKRPLPRPRPSPAPVPAESPASPDLAQKDIHAHRAPPLTQGAYATPQTARGSTIPRQQQVGTIRSPAARLGRGKPFAVSKPLRPPTKF